MTKTTGRRPSPEPQRQQPDQRAERTVDSAEVNRPERDGRHEQRRPIASFGVFAAHLTWFFVGPLALLLLLLGIAQAGTGWATVLDSVYFAMLAVVVAARWLDQRSGQSTTSTGEPSTWKDFRRWAMVFPPVAVGAWVAANLIGNHVF